MFNDLHEYFLTKKTEAKNSYLTSSFAKLPEDIFHASEHFMDLAKEESKSYHDPELIKAQIDYIILQELYCDKLTIHSEDGVKAWLRLESSYKKLESMLFEARHHTLRPTIESQIQRAKQISSEIASANDTQKLDKGDSITQGFIMFIAAIKKSHSQISLRESEYAVKHYTDTSEDLRKKLQEIRQQHKEALAERDILATQKNSQKPLTLLETWGADDHQGQANPLKRLVLWVNNLFSSQRIQDRAYLHSQQNASTTLAYNMKCDRITQLESDYAENLKNYRQTNSKLSIAENRHQSAQQVLGITSITVENLEQEETHDMKSTPTSP
ncbi:hypothetical protein [Legionella cardiaca]|uniref:Uncharacterized protein n=1 Tax=Legionella cardiaca TaxID=1071983 RepID=A0ABY8ASP0_9GAMM|nr:hypothetical protein [Legionella cardiaca]WED43683.1 hypothetical protein PXX05_02585 [Legionella cardiaca]